MEIRNSFRTYVTNCIVPVERSYWRLDPKRYSTWKNITRVIWGVKRLLYIFQSLKEHRDTGDLSIYELTDAETHLIRSV